MTAPPMSSTAMRLAARLLAHAYSPPDPLDVDLPDDPVVEYARHVVDALHVPEILLDGIEHGPAPVVAVTYDGVGTETRVTVTTNRPGLWRTEQTPDMVEVFASLVWLAVGEIRFAFIGRDGIVSADPPAAPEEHDGTLVRAFRVIADAARLLAEAAVRIPPAEAGTWHAASRSWFDRVDRLMPPPPADGPAVGE